MRLSDSAGCQPLAKSFRGEILGTFRRSDTLNTSRSSIGGDILTFLGRVRFHCSESCFSRLQIIPGWVRWRIGGIPRSSKLLQEQTGTWFVAAVIAVLTVFSNRIVESIKFALNRAALQSGS